MDLVIETERLQLRPPSMQDAEQIVELVGDKDVSWMLARVPHPYSIDDAHQWIDKIASDIDLGTEYAFCLFLPGDKLIGSCGLTQRGAYWEIGYWLGKRYWEQGFATEAGHAVLDWGREHLAAKGFLSGHIIENAASGRVLQKLGFERVGEKMMYVTARDERVRAIRYALDAPAEAALAPDAH